MGYKELAQAVLDKAEEDASQPRYSYEKQMSINFLCGTTPGFRDRFDLWCSLAQKITEDELRKNRERWRKDLCRKNYSYLNKLNHTR